MAINFIDGFEIYAPALNGSTPTSGTENNNTWLANIGAGRWTFSAGLAEVFGFAPSLNAIGGSALSLTQDESFITRTFASVTSGAATAQATTIGGFRMKATSNNIVFIHFYSGATQQAGIYVDSTNHIGVVGMNDSTILGTSSTTPFAANTTGYLEWSITAGSLGAFTLFYNGVSILTGTGNTNAASSGTFSSVQIGISNLSGAGLIVDDLYLDDGTGSILGTNPYIETHAASSASSVAFSPTAAIMGAAYQWSGNVGNAPGANTLFLRRFVAPTGGATLASVSCMPAATSAGANFKAVLYSDNAGAVNALIATGTQVTGTTNGTVLTGPFASGQILTGGTAYWIGYITDTSVSLFMSDSSLNGQSASNTYTGGAPLTPTMTTGQSDWMLWGNLTGTNNTACISDAPPVGPTADASYTSSNATGAEDLFNVSALSSTPASIYAVQVSGFLKNQASGARTVTLRTKSSTTDSNGSLSAFTPTTSYQWNQTMLLTDPATSAPWTIAGLNAALMGYEINS